MRDEFMITRQGKQYVLFAGLLDEAHTKFNNGLELDTELLQVPDETNGNVAIVKANFEGWEKDAENPIKTSGIGDASPENVGRNIAPHLIRMAETRAKARALRDAVNVGATSLEELSDSDSADAPASTQRTQRSYQRRSGSGRSDQTRPPSDIDSAREKKDTKKEPTIKAQIGALATKLYGSVDKWKQAQGITGSIDQMQVSAQKRLLQSLRSEEIAAEDEIPDEGIDIDEIEGVVKGGAQ